MYQDYFGLKEQAFSIAVNPRYLYMSQQHKEALAHLLYGVKGGGFVMLTGEVGTGKTTIIRCLLEQLPTKTEIAIVLNPMSNVHELLCTICDEFSIEYDENKKSTKSITDLLHQYLLNNHRQGKNTVLLIDEAQLLSPQVLEQIRLLTNLETASQKLLQIVLVGQPELNELLAQPRLRQLSQRITARFHLTPLTLEETQRYIQHRLSVAGMTENKNPFTPAIIKQIHRFTGGIPRMINILCERALVGAYGNNKPLIDKQIFSLAKKEVEGNRQSNLVTQAPFPIFLYGGISIAVGLILGIIFLLAHLLFSPTKVQHTSPNPQDVARSTQGIVTPAPSSTPQALTQTAGASESSSDNVRKLFAIADKTRAQSILFGHLDFTINPNAHPCWQINTQGQHCSTAKFDTWEEISSLNRPLVLSIVTPDKFNAHAVLIGLQGDSALVIGDDEKHHVIPLDTLGPLWTGEVFYAWKKPKDYKEPLSMGDRSTTVAEVADQFALLDAQPTPLTTKRFNKALRERVKIFQRENGLTSDGILGERTLMKLNESLGLSTTLSRDFL